MQNRQKLSLYCLLGVPILGLHLNSVLANSEIYPGSEADKTIRPGAKYHV